MHKEPDVSPVVLQTLKISCVLTISLIISTPIEDTGHPRTRNTVTNTHAGEAVTPCHHSSGQPNNIDVVLQGVLRSALT